MSISKIYNGETVVDSMGNPCHVTNSGGLVALTRDHLVTYVHGVAGITVITKLDEARLRLDKKKHRIRSVNAPDDYKHYIGRNKMQKVDSSFEELKSELDGVLGLGRAGIFVSLKEDQGERWAKQEGSRPKTVE